jgi:hypothetical protein
LTWLAGWLAMRSGLVWSGAEKLPMLSEWRETPDYGSATATLRQSFLELILILGQRSDEEEQDPVLIGGRAAQAGHI